MVYKYFFISVHKKYSTNKSVYKIIFEFVHRKSSAKKFVYINRK